jgi:FkbM family methyltransferase
MRADVPVAAIKRFEAWLTSPAAHKRESFRHHAYRVWQSALPWCPMILRCEPGIWWIARGDGVSRDLVCGTFERQEREFVARFLEPGMTVVDVGAHAGFYTLLAAKAVGPAGRVIAFEPSPREQRGLRRHLRLNGCRNVTIEPFALGDSSGDADLFVFDRTTGCNSFRPSQPAGTRAVRVAVRRLDDALAEAAVTRVDLIKMDIEGGELAALRGAERTFAAARPVLLAEVDDKRTAPWGYRARDIVQLVERWGYAWYSVTNAGRLAPLPVDRETLSGNAVAMPRERA